MSWLDIVATILKFAFELWKSRLQTPEVAKAKALAAATKEMSGDIEVFDEALANNDVAAISAHLSALCDRVRAHTSRSGQQGTGDNTG
jgi:hypothetical protein